jgi:hypothetical protein
MRYRILCAFGSVASVVAIAAIGQHKYPSHGPSFIASLAVALIGVAGLFSLALAIIGHSPGDKK